MPKAESSATGRKQWDKDEYSAKAKAKDAESASHAKEAQSAMNNGRKPKFNKPRDDLPKPTKELQAREGDLGIEKNLNKTMLVQGGTLGGRGPKGPGFYCEMCDKTLKDSVGYLDHVNSRSHLKRLGQTTQVSRSTLTQVRERIQQLRLKTAEEVNSKNFDFSDRLSKIRAAEEAERAARKEDRKRKREERRAEDEMRAKGILPGAKGAFGNTADLEKAEREREELAGMMGFGGFGGSAKR